MKICKSCGAPVAEGKKFCSACGAQVSDSQEKSSTEKNKRMLKVVISATAIIAILCIVIPLSLTFAKETKVKSNISLGNKYLLEGKYEEAILVFEKVISIDKKDVDARLKLTELYLKTKRFDDANKVSMEILDIAPSDKEIYIKAADLMIREGRTDDAVSYLKKVFEKTKDSLIEKKLEELRAAQPLTSIEASIFQGETYNLPDKIKLNINNSEEEHPVKWTNPSVDTKTPGTYNFEGMVEEYDRKVRLILTVWPKDLFQVSGSEVSMNSKQKEDLDKFLTTFSVLHTDAFENSNISDEELIRFGASYINWMEWDKVETNNGSYTGSIKASDVDEKCMYYFGKKPSAHKSIQYYNYSNGKYTYELASGEAVTTSQIDHLFELGDNLYEAEISTSLENSGGSYMGPGEKRSAIIRKVTENNTERYILISYKLQNSNTSASNTTPADSPADFSSWKADASSVLTENTGSHPAGYANDKNLSTAWVEGAQGDGIGEWIKFSGTSKQTLSGLRIINGYSKSNDLYNKNNRVKKIRIELSDGSVFEKNLSDGIMNSQIINLDRQIKTNYVKITILEVFRGSQYRDTCISEIELF